MLFMISLTVQKYTVICSVCIGGTDLSNRSHSPNEYMRIDRLNKTIKCIAVILETFA
jgi:acetylornithine deacetylase/succinyl-diaminopimelate desuccinylase-like protein